MSDDIGKLILEITDVDEIKRAAVEKLGSSVSPLDIINSLNRSLDEVGRRYEKGDLFLSQLIMIGYLSSEVTKLLKPYLKGKGERSGGKVVIGTVKGDIHDIGKNIVVMMLEAGGYEVIDLGVDVPAEKFIQVVKEDKPDVLCLSALLTSTMTEMEKVIDALETSGLRRLVKVVVGGRPVAKEFAEEIGADGYAEDSVKAVKVIKELLGGA